MPQPVTARSIPCTGPETSRNWVYAYGMTKPGMASGNTSAQETIRWPGKRYLATIQPQETPNSRATASTTMLTQAVVRMYSGRTVETRCPSVPAISPSWTATKASAMTGAAVSSAIRMAPARRKSGRATPTRSGTGASTAGPIGGRSLGAVGSGLPGIGIMQARCMDTIAIENYWHSNARHLRNRPALRRADRDRRPGGAAGRRAAGALRHARGSPRGAARPLLQPGTGRDRLPARTLGLRQDNRAARGRRLRAAGERLHPHRRQGRQRLAPRHRARSSRGRRPLPGLRPLPAPRRDRQHRIRPAAAGSRHPPPARRRDAGAGRSPPDRRSLSARALGRPAAAGRARARAGALAVDPAARRAVLQPRPGPAGAARAGPAGDPGTRPDHRAARDARPVRGIRARRPGRRDARRPDRTMGYAVPALPPAPYAPGGGLRR